jgi:hypothetical protein
MLPDITPKELLAVTWLVYLAAASPALINELDIIKMTGSRLKIAARVTITSLAL